jgi:hypothetical protein
MEQERHSDARLKAKEFAQTKIFPQIKIMPANKCKETPQSNEY